jgi:SAM-dependent methyltransferase
VTEGGRGDVRGGIHPDANAFGDAAADYERARPSYPPESIEVLRREIGLGPGMRVCDLAAGTGKLTRLLAGTGADVVAVEPVAGMRAQLTDVLPDVEALDGTAEAIPLDDQSVDALTVAQAFHWFTFETAFAEIRRVLRVGGGLAILFNERDERDDWVKAWSDLIGWHRNRVSQYQSIDWDAAMNDGGFAEPGHAEIPWMQTITRDVLAARVRSVSYIAVMPAEEQQDYVDKVVALTDGFGETFDLTYVTHVWWATRT